MPERNETAEFAARVACWLPGWRYDALEREGFRLPQLIGEHGARLEFHVNWKSKGMVSVRGMNAGYRSPSIGISLTRDPKAAAADIQRRLIPEYLKQYAEERERKATESAAAAAYENVVHCFEAVGMIRGHTHGWNSSTLMHNSLCRCEIQSTENIEFTASVNPDEAIRLVAFINSIKEVIE